MVSGARGTGTLFAALLVYFFLCFFTVRGVGLVGEVAIGWALPSPPTVLVQLEPPVSGDGAGVVRASRTRPTERLVLGPVELPLAVNAYTGGLADWPSRAAVGLARPFGAGIPAGLLTHVALGALLLALAHRFLTFHGSRVAAGAAALVLATDWCFVFYRKVLGGTEILLQAAALLILWALWSRRWKGGQHGTVAIAIGVGLGLAAKATFVATLGAFALVVLATRWDHPLLKPPRRVHPGILLGLPLLFVAPLVLAGVHAAASDLPELRSHDTLSLQWARLVSGWTNPAPSREGTANLLYFFGNPLRFFADAYGAAAVPPVSILRVVGFGVTVLGGVLAWRDRAPGYNEALLRFLTLFVPVQIGALWLANRDLHHLAQATVPLALWIGLAAERVAATTAPPRSVARAALALLLISPHLVAGVLHLADTDRVVATITTPSFTERGQTELVALLQEHGVTDLVCSDYELYGMLEARAPHVRVTHTWGAVANGANGEAVLRTSVGRWYLAVKASAPMVYNWSPTPRKVEVTSELAGVRATPVGSIGEPVWATLYRVE